MTITMELLKQDGHLPAFALPDAQTGHSVVYASFLRKHRLVVFALDYAGEMWLQNATRHAREFAERDMVVLAVTKRADKPGALPGGFHVLRDADGAVLARLGGPPAFYLVGKDSGIKIASRAYPSLGKLFGTIDAMPMRAAEKRERGG